MSEAKQNPGRSLKRFVTDYSDLLVYRITFQLSKEIFELSKEFPKEEMYALAAEQAEKMNKTLLEIGRLLNGMIEKSSAFVLADDRVREDPSIDEFF
jgi:hypothetical protein